MKKLNFGCGHRFAAGWENVDFHSEHPEVRKLNLLQRLPYGDGEFDVVYSSHVLEHFPRATSEAILRECHRIMKPGGLIRTVLPDLENICREYLRILDQVDSSEEARQRYDWIILELLDQMVRTQPSGLMGAYRRKLVAAQDQALINYVKSRTDTNPWSTHQPSAVERLRAVTWNKIRTKLTYLRVAMVKRLLPSSLRDVLMDDSRIGEKHRWMYDRHGLGELMRQCGFDQVRFLSASESAIPGFAADHLDVESDGKPYKSASLFCEARKN